MKKTILKTVALSLVALMLCVAFASCSNAPKGTYESERGLSLEFAKEEVVVSWTNNGKTTSIDGTFEMGENEDGEATITITLPESGWGDWLSGDAWIKESVDGTHEYNSGKDNNGEYIEIGDVKYYKK